MYLSQISIENFRCFGEGAQRFELRLKPGLTALVGENDSGKTAVIDALRFAFGTTDQEWLRIEDTDFHEGGVSREIKILCTFEGLLPEDKRAFLEYLTHQVSEGHEPILHVNWIAKDTGEIRHGRPYRVVEVRSGRNGDGPAMAQEVRDLLQATYLRPLRDAEHALSAGRGSRLAQVLRHSPQVVAGGSDYDENRLLKEQTLSIGAITKLLEELLQNQQGITNSRNTINSYLRKLALEVEEVSSDIRVAGATQKEEIRVRQLLEKLDLVLAGAGILGLGTNNLLFMACELVLLGQEEAGNRLLLIEEPEAHLHAQRQLQVMRYLQKQANDSGIQVIVTTHSPNLASAIDLGNIVMIHGGHAYSMAEGETKLEQTDYRFLQRFLDVTKANLFFARGVMIVEGDAENILLPTLARLIGRDFTAHGVSIVNVGGIGLRRYARIFQRAHEDRDGELAIPVACVTDMDVMPDCAPDIVGKIKEDAEWPPIGSRRWRAKKDFGDEGALGAHRKAKEDKASGQKVKTFVSDQWTLEFDLALGPRSDEGKFHGGLAEEVLVAANLAQNDDAINTGAKCIDVVAESALQEFAGLKGDCEGRDSCDAEEVLATKVYAKFARDGVSKAIAAQYLSELLALKCERGDLTAADLRKLLPPYLCAAIDYVTGVPMERPTEQDSNDE